jgi:hypothetical protein
MRRFDYFQYKVEKVRPGLFQVGCAATHVRGTLHLSNTQVFERWRSIPRPHRRLLKNEFLGNLPRRRTGRTD